MTTNCLQINTIRPTRRILPSCAKHLPGNGIGSGAIAAIRSKRRLGMVQSSGFMARSAPQEGSRLPDSGLKTPTFPTLPAGGRSASGGKCPRKSAHTSTQHFNPTLTRLHFPPEAIRVNLSERVSPLRGSPSTGYRFPGLTPGATLCRPSGSPEPRSGGTM